MEGNETRKMPSFGYAMFTMALILGGIMVLGAVFGFKMQVLFLLAWIVAFPLCMKIGYKYTELQKGMFAFMPRCLLPVVFTITIGALIGAWNASGTIAAVTHLGMKIINPSYFQVTSFIICILFSMITGTSWGTCGTIGIALMGVALGMGFNPLVAASPIICGAFVGDGLSPLSDTTNIISGAVGVDLFSHIKYQLRVTIPTIIISAVIFFVLGLNNHFDASSTGEIASIMDGIAGNFRLGFIPMIPVILVIALLCFKVPTIPSLLCGGVGGLLVATLYQGHTAKAVIDYMWSGYTMSSGDAFIDKLFSRGGMSSMTGTAFMIVVAFGLFGILNTAGVLDALVEPLSKRIHTNVGATICALLLGVLGNLSSSTTFAEVFTSNVLNGVYDKAGLDRLDLANAMTVGCLIFGLWIPWNTNPVAVAASLDVDPLRVAPYLVTPFVYFGVLMVLAVLKQKKRGAAH
ncbi:Na+/H+ antiporter NhaC family protein [Enterocloster lavalensis]|uniref:Na+/H+ antiporter NhaC family protein n=3 Tax=Enterocloster lavalensis TaxID=460384 RepID=UPI002A839694|nr:Na+/H+ antiporter NhaC family protein [Enterocloster lavalensis]